MAKDSIGEQHPIGKDFYTPHIQVRIKMILSIQKILLIVTIVYLVLFFALGSGLFNSIIEGTARRYKDIYHSFKINSDNRRNNCDNNDLIYWNGGRIPAV